MKLELKVKELSIKDIEYILDGAFSGCAYWCGELYIEYKNTTKDDYNDLECTSEKCARALLKNERLAFVDIEFEDEINYLTYDKLLKGLEKFIKESKNINLSRMFEGDFDIDDCDMIIQYALFNEIMFC